VTAIVRVLEDVASDCYVVPASVVRGLEAALDAMLNAIPTAEGAERA
jgi:hypothetical protein